MVASTVLMVAEKPSIALSIASALSHGQMSTRKGSTDVHEFDGRFLGHHAHYKVTSVIGHVFSIDFPAGFQDWKTTDPLDLFQASVIKTVSNPKAHIRQHLSREARGCDCLVLWLDCDREGENICFEVIECTGFGGNEIRKKVYRARFSSVTEKDILKALDNLVQPNRNEALAVDARQEIDLKVGVAFTRFQTTFFQGKYGNLDSRLISYGPCQTPTLGFCVQRHLQITTFKPEKFWSVCPYIMQNGYELNLDWERGKLFDCDVTAMFQKRVMEDGIAEVTEISEKQENKVRPSGLNTVNLLKVASSALGFGPQMAMQLAERLYTQGFISYPRTESTAYPSSFDFKGTLHSLVKNPEWGDYVRMLLSDGYSKPRSGTDVGDHPPITPMGLATEDMLGRDAWRLYQYVCQHFIGSLSSDCKYIRTKIQFSIAGEIFNCTGSRVMVKGFTSIMPWLAPPSVPIPAVPIPSVPIPAVPIPPVTVPPVITNPSPGTKKPCPPSGKETCPIDTLKLGACVDLLGGLVHIGVGDPAANACCPIISGLAELEAAVCLCTTLKIKALNLNIYVPIALQLLITCGKTPPPGYTCSL